VTFPHCDQRILHAPEDKCPYCNLHADWQELRAAWGIAFTGHLPTGDELPCPADHNRPQGSPGWHGNWAGNRNKGSILPDADEIRLAVLAEPTWPVNL
jgi:hypothetical protein